MVASEKWWGYSNRHTLFIRRLPPPRESPAPQSDSAQRRTEPADLHPACPSPPTPIPYTGDSFCSRVVGGLTSSRNALLWTVL
jgi:hypothetical protein